MEGINTCNIQHITQVSTINYIWIVYDDDDLYMMNNFYDDDD